MLRRGDSVGVFQLEGGPMRALMRSLAPTCFEDIGALVALYRPGPMAANMHNDFADRKNGRKPITGPHPEFSEVLADTYGLMIYQEGLLRIAERFAGYSAYEGDVLRKACGKKIRALMATEREKFVAACERNGYGAELGSTIFDIIEPFADYAFRKSHAFCYGKVAYQTAWLKANHPVEYLAALLTSVKDDKDKTAVYLAECRTMGIDVLVPDINKSMSDFVTFEGKIPFGLSAIRNVGEGLVAQIVAERDASGAFADFYDFCFRVSPMVLNKRSVESLIKAGAFDSLGHPRRGLLMVFEQVIDRTLARRREADLGIMSLFGDLATQLRPKARGRPSTSACPSPTWSSTRPSGWPMRRRCSASTSAATRCSGWSRPCAGTPTAPSTSCGSCATARCAGSAAWSPSLSRKYTKRGDLMATFTLEDLQSAIEVFVFPRTMLDYGALLSDDAVVCVKGRIDLREEPAKIVCMELKRPDLSPEHSRPVRIKLDPSRPHSPVPGPAEGRAPRAPREPTRARPSRLNHPAASRRVPGRRRKRAGRRVARTARSEWTSGVTRSNTGGARPTHGTTGRDQRLHGVERLRALGDGRHLRRRYRRLRRRHPLQAGGGVGAGHPGARRRQAQRASRSARWSASAARRRCIIGMASVKRTARRDAVLRCLVGEQLRRAVLAFPDEDVLVGTRFLDPVGFAAFEGLEDIVPRPGHKASGEERAWGRRLAKRFGAEGRVDDRSFLITGTGDTPPALDHECIDASGPRPLGGGLLRRPRPLPRRRADRLRLGHGRVPGRPRLQVALPVESRYGSDFDAPHGRRVLRPSPHRTRSTARVPDFDVALEITAERLTTPLLPGFVSTSPASSTGSR